MLRFWSEKWAKIRLKNARFLPWFLGKNIDDIAAFRKENQTIIIRLEQEKK